MLVPRVHRVFLLVCELLYIIFVSGTVPESQRIGCFHVDLSIVPEIKTEFYEGNPGFSRYSIKEECQEHCGRVANNTYFGIRRKSSLASYASCFCTARSDLLRPAPRCIYNCGSPSFKCGGASENKWLLSLLSVCGPGHFSSNSTRVCTRQCHCADRELCRFSDGLCKTPGCLSGWRGAACDKDINECLDNNGGCNHNCENTHGSYSCWCNTGYHLQTDGKICTDDDECARNNGDCEDTCVDTQGSYRCECNQGYQLNGDNRTCGDLDECEEGKHNSCEQICDNTEGSYKCRCYMGYNLVDEHKCNDINECDESATLCGDDVCYNIPGGYRCCTKHYTVPQGHTQCLAMGLVLYLGHLWLAPVFVGAMVLSAVIAVFVYRAISKKESRKAARPTDVPFTDIGADGRSPMDYENTDLSHQAARVSTSMAGMVQATDPDSDSDQGEDDYNEVGLPDAPLYMDVDSEGPTERAAIMIPTQPEGVYESTKRRVPPPPKTYAALSQAKV